MAATLYLLLRCEHAAPAIECALEPVRARMLHLLQVLLSLGRRRGSDLRTFGPQRAARAAQIAFQERRGTRSALPILRTPDRVANEVIQPDRLAIDLGDPVVHLFLEKVIVLREQVHGRPATTGNRRLKCLVFLCWELIREISLT